MLMVSFYSPQFVLLKLKAYYTHTLSFSQSHWNNLVSIKRKTSVKWYHYCDAGLRSSPFLECVFSGKVFLAHLLFGEKYMTKAV